MDGNVPKYLWECLISFLKTPGVCPPGPWSQLTSIMFCIHACCLCLLPSQLLPFLLSEPDSSLCFLGPLVGYYQPYQVTLHQILLWNYITVSTTNIQISFYGYDRNNGKTTENEGMVLFWFFCLLFVFDSPFLWLAEFFAVGFCWGKPWPQAHEVWMEEVCHWGQALLGYIM